MKKVLKKTGKILLYFLAAFVILIVTILIIIRINSREKPEPIVDANGNELPNSIAIIKDTVINGAPQRLTIRGYDISNPVLLRVHGGPGEAHAPQAFRFTKSDLEDLFTVCYWDQRGGGPAYDKSIPDSSITKYQIVKDGLAVSEYLRKFFKKDKIYIEGTSWGTVVSAYMIKEKPEYFKAYIGIGQVSNQPESEILSYGFVRDEARRRNDTVALKEMDRIGSPPYNSIEESNAAVQVERQYVARYAPHNLQMSTTDIMKLILLYPGWSMDYKINILQNGMYGPAAPLLWPENAKTNLFVDIPEWPIPVYILQGDSDHFTETVVAQNYFDTLLAPEKKTEVFKNTGHVVYAEKPEKYREFYIKNVLK